MRLVVMSSITLALSPQLCHLGHLALYSRHLALSPQFSHPGHMALSPQPPGSVTPATSLCHPNQLYVNMEHFKHFKLKPHCYMPMWKNCILIVSILYLQPRCHRYWPNKDETLTFDDISVTLVGLSLSHLSIILNDW